LRLRDSDSQADIPDTQTPARLKHKLQKSTDKKRTERPDRPEAKDASASSGEIKVITESDDGRGSHGSWCLVPYC
jgi:hypothetical protein